MSFANTLKYVFMATSANFGNMLPYTQLSRVFALYSHAAGISSGPGRYSFSLYRYCGDGEKDILSEGSLLASQSCRS